jgi:hypothetical protein
MKFKDWMQLKEIVNGGMGTEPLQSPMVNLSLGNNTALHGLISGDELPPTNKKYNKKYLPPEYRPVYRPVAKRRKERRIN